MYYIEIVQNLLQYKGKHGLYIIRPKSSEILRSICEKLDYEYKSDVAYIGKGSKTDKSDLCKRAKQEMGWSNFEGATFVRKIGRFLDLDIKDKKNKVLKEKTRQFICSNFTIECICFHEATDLLEKETEYIINFKPCLNDKKNARHKK
jgi:hypothetical protein